MMSGIASISGRIGNYCFRTMKSTGKVYVQARKTTVRRTRDVSEAMQAQRKRFATISQIVRAMMKSGTRLTRKQLWKKAAAVYDAQN